MRVELNRPDLLYLLLALPVWWVLVWPRAGGGVFYTRGDSARRLSGWLGARGAAMLALPRLLRSASLACLIVALAEPQEVEVVRDVALRGKAIGLAVDISSSMLAEDMEGGRSRLTVAREAAISFAEQRLYDELSLVAFAGEAMTRVPPTLDANVIVAGVRSLDVQLLADGTDISTGILTSVARMQDSEKEPRVVVLLTDGAHNGVGVPPLAAARVAEALGVKVHAISMYGVDDPSRMSAAQRAFALEAQRRNEAARETVLMGVASLTGGEYFRATGAAALDSIYREINRIERPVQEVIEREVRHPLRGSLLFLGLVLLGIDVVLRGSRWGLVP